MGHTVLLYLPVSSLPCSLQCGLETAYQKLHGYQGLYPAAGGVMLLLPCQDRALFCSQSLTEIYKLGVHENCAYDV